MSDRLLILATENTEQLRSAIETLNSQVRLDITPAGLDDTSTHLFLFSDGAIDCNDMIVVSTANQCSKIKRVISLEFLDAVEKHYGFHSQQA